MAKNTLRSNGDARSLARSFTALSVNTLAGICTSRKAAHRDKIEAANSLLDRGWGKPQGDGDGAGEIKIIIRQLVEPTAATHQQPPLIEGEAIEVTGDQRLD